MRSVDARGGMPACLSRRALFAGAAAAAAVPAVARASEPCPEELEHALSMHQYRLQFQSWSGPVRSGGGHFISHCVRSISSSMAFVDWKGPGLAGYVDESAALFVQRTYSRAEFTREPTVLWYGGRPTDRDTDIVIPRTSAIEVDVPYTSAGAFYLPNEAMVRAAWASSVSADDNLGDLRARAEKVAASQFMRVSLWFSATLQKGDRAEAPARAGYNGTCAIDTRGNVLSDVFGLRLADAIAHRTVFGSSNARPLTRGTGRVTEEFGGAADLGARPPASFALKPTRLMIVGPDGATPIASIGVGVIA